MFYELCSSLFELRRGKKSASNELLVISSIPALAVRRTFVALT